MLKGKCSDCGNRISCETIGNDPETCLRSEPAVNSASIEYKMCSHCVYYKEDYCVYFDNPLKGLTMANFCDEFVIRK